MKRLLVVMLLMLGISAVVSCNSYDVEGKPEIASNPAKKVFNYNPWEKDDSSASQSGDNNSGENDNVTPAENPEENDDADTTLAKSTILKTMRTRPKVTIQTPMELRLKAMIPMRTQTKKAKALFMRTAVLS